MNNIPKLIHYCWFGGRVLPPLARLCIDSWKRYLPEYSIVEWNESNFDTHCCRYVEEANQAKKWAFVSDFARFQILYNYGGIYFDVDVEVIKDIGPIIGSGSFMGTERGSGNSIAIAPGLGMAAIPNLGIYKEIIDGYSERSFYLSNGDIDYTTVVEYVTNIFQKHGYIPQDKDIDTIENITIYPPEYFCPKDFWTRKINITNHTYTIHHYNASWLPLNYKIKNTVRRLVGEKFWYFLYRMKNSL